MWKGEEGRDEMDVFLEHVEALLEAAAQEAALFNHEVTLKEKYRARQRKHIRWLAVECRLHVSELNWDKLGIAPIKKGKDNGKETGEANGASDSCEAGTVCDAATG